MNCDKILIITLYLRSLFWNFFGRPVAEIEKKLLYTSISDIDILVKSFGSCDWKIKLPPAERQKLLRGVIMKNLYKNRKPDSRVVASVKYEINKNHGLLSDSLLDSCLKAVDNNAKTRLTN